MQVRFGRMAWLSYLALAACSNGNEPRVQPCTATNSVAVGALPLAGYSSLTPSEDGCALFSANTGPDTIEYVVVARLGASENNRQASFRLAGEASLMGPASAIMAALQATPPLSPAEQFHTMLRERESRRDYGPVPSGPTAQLNLTQPPPVVGDMRTFKVCSSLTCARPMTTVNAIAKVVGQNLALFVDLTAQNSLTLAEYQEMVAAFDQKLYPADTTAFGTPSDRDNNGVVIALMTPAINRLVNDSTCVTSGFIAGYFFGADIDPAADFNPDFNKSEMFYTLVPDPNGDYSCSHSVQRIRDLVPSVFVHELQHMISFNYHVLIPQRSSVNTEVLWLNEALSHYAEELGGRSYLPGDNQTFSKFLSGNIRNAYDYMSHTGDHFLVANWGTGTLGERGAGWLFVRYLIDQLAIDTTAAAWGQVSRGLVQTTAVGPANIVATTGVPFEQTLANWLLALWVSDLPNFNPPSELKYRSWRFRTTYAPLYPSVFARPYPLEPEVRTGADVDITGTLRSGSGVFERVVHPPGAAAFTLQLAEGDGRPVHPVLAPRLTIIRVR